MTELKRLLLIAITTPFVALGVVWQIISIGFMAGRMLTTEWIGRLASEVIVKLLGLAAPTNLGTGPKGTKGLH